MSNKFYVYIAFRTNGVPCYVGKGSGDRANPRKKRGTHYDNILKAAGRELPILIIHDELDETTAFVYEELFIRSIGIERNGGPLSM